MHIFFLLNIIASALSPVPVLNYMDIDARNSRKTIVYFTWVSNTNTPICIYVLLRIIDSSRVKALLPQPMMESQTTTNIFLQNRLWEDCPMLRLYYNNPHYKF